MKAKVRPRDKPLSALEVNRFENERCYEDKYNYDQYGTYDLGAVAGGGATSNKGPKHHACAHEQA